MEYNYAEKNDEFFFDIFVTFGMFLAKYSSHLVKSILELLSSLRIIKCLKDRSIKYWYRWALVPQNINTRLSFCLDNSTNTCTINSFHNFTCFSSCFEIVSVAFNNKIPLDARSFKLGNDIVLVKL